MTKFADNPVSAGGVGVQIDQALNARAGESFQRMLPVIGFVYLAISIPGFAQRPEQGIPVSIWLALATWAAASIVWVLLHEKRMRPGFVHPAAFTIGALIALQSIVDFYQSAAHGSFAVLVMVLLGGAATLLSIQWYMLLAALTVVGWLIVGAAKLTILHSLPWSLALLSVGALTVLGARTRIRSHRQIEESRQSIARRAAEKERAIDRLRMAVEGTQDGHWYWELDSGAFYFSAAWAQLLGYEECELSQNADEWFSRVDQWYVPKLRAELADHLNGSSPTFRSEHRMSRKDGLFLWTLARAAVVRDESGKAIALAGSHTDISPLVESEKRLLSESFLDQLTGLANRNFFMGRLRNAFEEHQRRGLSSPLFALMFLDLDRFKIINDSLGHLVGDELLKEVANRLRASARTSDVVARFGGDEFVILLERLRDPEEAVRIATRIQKALAQPFHIGGREIASGASIGIALSSEQFACEDDLLRYGDIAMYHAKTQRRGQAQLFEPGMLEPPTKICNLQNDLARALERQQLVLHYQPCFSLRTGKIVGAEALIRWQRPDGLLLAPSEFVPLAEEMGLINDIGEWVLRAACQQNRAWQNAGIPALRMAVNLSAKQLQQKDFPRTVASILDESGLPLRWLELELTETALMDSLDTAAGTLEQLQMLGVRMSIDDFGTGYSSLNYLRKFHFHTLKIDRCFVADMTVDKKAGAIAKGLIALAHNLDLSVIAEGVEEDDQLAFLKAERCDQVQGYLTGRPMPPDQLEAILRSGAVCTELASANTGWESGLSHLSRIHELEVGRTSGMFSPTSDTFLRG